MPHVLVGYLATRLSVVHDVCTWCVNGASTCEGWFEEAIVLGMYTKNLSKTINVLFCAMAVCCAWELDLVASSI